MHVEFILAAIVLVVAILVGADYFRRTGDNPQEYAPQEYPGKISKAGPR